MYEWEISLRGSNLAVMRSRRQFEDYDSAKEDLIRAIRTDFDNLVRCEGVEYNYTVFDSESVSHS